MAAYGKTEYWDERYTRDPNPFEWYQRWSGIKDVIVNSGLSKDHRILVVGCGNSRLSEDMYDEGYTHIMNIDVSSVVIKAMQEKYADKKGLVYKQMSCFDMKEFDDESFDCVLDKGTADSILCSDSFEAGMKQALKEISRVLKPSGIFFCISYGLPDHRLMYFQNNEYNWTVMVQTVMKPLLGAPVSLPLDETDRVHYIYICVKSGNLENTECENESQTPGEVKA